MSIKMPDLNREEVEKLMADYNMHPAFTGQKLYIASGPSHEVLAGLMPSGLYQVELLDKKQIEESLQRTIRVFGEYADARTRF
jgi:hypothetical protein